MRPTLPALAAVLLTPVLLPAQVRQPDARPMPAEQRPASAELGRACELSTSDGLTLAFAVCPPLGAGEAAREVEIVEYRNGDSPVRASRVTVRGVVRGDLAARSLSWGDPDDDADGVADAARARPGRMKVGRVTLRRTDTAGADSTGLPWEDGDVDGDGFPLTVDLQDPSGATTTVSFRGCRAVPARERATDDVTLACREVRAVAALDANPYARFIARSTDRSAKETSVLNQRPAPATAGADASRSARGLRLHGVRVESWSVDFDSARRGGPARWTLEVRVNRIEMA